MDQEVGPHLGDSISSYGSQLDEKLFGCVAFDVGYPPKDNSIGIASNCFVENLVEPTSTLRDAAAFRRAHGLHLDAEIQSKISE